MYDINNQVKLWPEFIVDDPDVLPERIEAKQPVIVYRPMRGGYSPDAKSELEFDFSEFSRVVWPYTNYVLIVDEAHWLQSAAACEPALAGFVRMSDPSGIDLFQTAHAPADMWARARSLASDWYLFRMTRTADLEAVELQCGEEVREKVKTLGPHDYLHFDMDNDKWEINADPASWYVNVKSPARKELAHAGRDRTGFDPRTA